MVKIVQKPWGHEEWWAHTDKYVGKLLFIKKGHRLSLQFHNEKEETMRVMEGDLVFTKGDTEVTLHPGDSVHVTPGTIHRMEARDSDVTVIEVSTTQVDDVVRLQDDYDRRGLDV
jgi:mannose-6-phosphate isomerase-like protein (cupin superfamily)